VKIENQKIIAHYWASFSAPAPVLLAWPSGTVAQSAHASRRCAHSPYVVTTRITRGVARSPAARRWPVGGKVLLESAKDRILGVDTPGQHVSPRVRYETTCWLIRKALVSLSCRKRGTGMAIPMRPQGARGAMRVFCCTQEGKTLAIMKGVWGYTVIPNKGKHMANQDIRSGVNLRKGI
jgi:hypothetical protein